MYTIYLKGSYTCMKLFTEWMKELYVIQYISIFSYKTSPQINAGLDYMQGGRPGSEVNKRRVSNRRWVHLWAWLVNTCTIYISGVVSCVRLRAHSLVLLFRAQNW